MVELAPHQKSIVRVELEKNNVLLVAPMGAGKTLATLTAVSALVLRRSVKNVLIIAPKRVATSVWPQEALQFDMGLNIRFCKRALDVKLFLLDGDTHHVCVCSVTRITDIPHGCWDMVIIDESTTMKHKSSKRSREARRICNGVPRRVLLSGTPVHNGLIGLWHQCFLLDGGAALGKTLTEFYRRYCRVKFKVNGMVSVYEIDPEREAELLNDCKHLVYVVSIANDGLPPCLFKTLAVDLPKGRRSEYNEFKLKCIVTFKEETGGDDPFLPDNIVAFSRAALGMKLRQMASGFVYDEEGKYFEFHREKINALKDLREMYDGPLLVMYCFKCERNEILREFPEARQLESDADIADWNNRKISMAVSHPASIGHGLNLQFGGSVVIWFGLQYDAELYAQANKRLHRRGQTEAVSIVHIVTKNTIDERILKILTTKEDEAKRFERI